MIRELLARREPALAAVEPDFRDFRAGDVRHSLADVSRARELLGYSPTHHVGEGLIEAIDWYVEQAEGRSRGFAVRVGADRNRKLNGPSRIDD